MNILFLCVGNSARSQIAEGLSRSMLGKEHYVKSAGSMPTGKIHPLAVKTMKDVGIDISSYQSKSIDDLENKFIKSLDFVVTLCAEEICPVLSSKAEKLHWPIEDPANENFTEFESNIAFEKTREDIFQLIKKFFILNVDV